MCPENREDKTEPNFKKTAQTGKHVSSKIDTDIAPSASDRTVIAGHKIDSNSQEALRPTPTELKKSLDDFKESAEFSNDDATRFQPPEESLDLDATRLVSDATYVKPTPPAIMPPFELDAEPESFILKQRFLMEKVLGVGGMGVVYRAKDRLKVEAKDKDPYVAIKVLSDEFKTHPEAFISLQRESRKTQRLSHTNIVKVFDFDKDGELFFMTMEYMEGKPLDRLIKQYSATGLPLEDVWTIIDGMCSALSYAHIEKIVHADFKPGNIFVTTSGMAKIFDFGIARAVTNIDKNESGTADRTIFDAGNLGALTPAYASYEMLKGEEPDVRDDIYALGCITYELLSGKHPFDKIPADEAKNRRLKPKRIPKITKRQWRAIEKALAFDRKDRIETVDLFYHELTDKPKSRWLLSIFFILVVAGITALFFNIKKEAEVDQSPVISENDIRNEIELQVRADFHKEELEKLILNPTFSIIWEENIWNQYSGMSELLPQGDVWLASVKEKIYTLYIKNIQDEMGAANHERASGLVKNSYRFAGDTAVLKDLEIKIADALRRLPKTEQAATPVKPRPVAEPVVIAKSEVEPRSTIDEYNLALSNAHRQLECRSRLNMRDFAVAIDKIKSLDINKYQSIKEELVTSLASCITEEAKRFPERALESKKSALRIFDDHALIAAISIVSRDACDDSIAGLGGSGKRAACRDTIKGVGDGPELVVIPTGKNIKSFAIGKYEVSTAEFRFYCDQTGRCVTSASDSGLPITGQPLSAVRDYLKWLTEKTGNKYRLPTKDEWVHAANATAIMQDPNRNCQFSSRGIQKGDGLIRTTIGRNNAWGLVNYLGNVQEWVYGKSGQIVAVGGSYLNSMDECQITTLQEHSGQADEATGFRVVREVSAN